MDNDNENNNGEGDYGQEDANYEGDNAGGNEGDAEVDQYFDDAGDIGYLPADHVTAA